MLSRADRGRRFKTADARRRDQFFERLIVVRGIAIDGVEPIAFDADAACGHTIFVDWQSSGISREAKSRGRLLDVAARQGRELNAVEWTTGTEADAGWKVFLDDETGGAR